MQRSLLNRLLKWKDQPTRKPLLIDGARQTGKTYLLNSLLGTTFPNTLRIDFLENPAFRAAFEGSLTPSDILDNLQLITNTPFDPATDLLILDEIGECERAVTSLKYFAEQTPTYFVAASGSNIGLLNSFPVGKVEQHNLYPLSFEEFIQASGETALIKAFNAQSPSSVAHQRLMDQLTDYFFTGGMPEAVAAWFDTANTDMLERVEAIGQIHADLVQGYQRDFGKYSGKVNARLIEAVFKSIPSQLSIVNDQSVNRFKFKGVHERKSRYGDFETAIHWLINCRLTLPNYLIEGTPRLPLAAYRKDNRVKLFMFDVGLLNHMLGSRYQEIKQQSYEYKAMLPKTLSSKSLCLLALHPLILGPMHAPRLSFWWPLTRARLFQSR